MNYFEGSHPKITVRNATATKHGMGLKLKHKIINIGDILGLEFNEFSQSLLDGRESEISDVKCVS